MASRAGRHHLEVHLQARRQYTSEAKQLKVQGDVVLRVTFTANGQVWCRASCMVWATAWMKRRAGWREQIRFRPATRNGQAVDMTTNITISFQLA